MSWSDEVYRIFGFQPQEFGATYEAFLEAVHPEDRAAVDAAYSSSPNEGRPSYECLRTLEKTGEQAAHLTRQMLAYAGKGLFVLERVNLSELAREGSGLLQSSIPKRITFQFQLDPNIPAVESDPSQMHPVFMNLALNAVEAIGSASGVISIATGEASIDAGYIKTNLDGWAIEPGRFAFLQVHDTGCGMDAETKAKIFDPFFTTKFTGRGLGLAAVAGIVSAKGRYRSDYRAQHRHNVPHPAARDAGDERGAMIELRDQASEFQIAFAGTDWFANGAGDLGHPPPSDRPRYDARLVGVGASLRDR